MVNELDVGNSSIFIEADSNCDEEVVLGRWSKGTGVLLVDDADLGGTHVILAVHVRFADAADFSRLHEFNFAGFVSNCLGKNSESLVEGEHFLALVHNLRNSVLLLILVKFALDPKSLVVLVIADSEFGQVSKLGQQRVLLISAEHTEANWLDLLVSLGLQGLIVGVLDVADGRLLPEANLLGLLEIESINLGQTLLQLEELVLVLLDFEFVLFGGHLGLHVPFNLIAHFLLLHVLELGVELLVVRLKLILLFLQLRNLLLESQTDRKRHV